MTRSSFPLRAFFGTSVLGLVVGLSGPAAADPLTPEQFSTWLASTIATIESEYVLPLDLERLRLGALRGMVEGLDPHSAFLTAEDLRIFEGDTSGRFGGVGLEVDFREEQVVVMANVDGSPAARAGIEAGDKVIAIEGYRASDLRPHEIVRKMRGPIGTKVRLTVLGRRDEKTREISLVRETIHVKSVQSAMLSGGVLFLRIKAFQEETHDELTAALAAHDPENVRGVILDLRNNPGGLVREAVAIADEFLESGVVFSLRARGKVLRETNAKDGGICTTTPLVVLVNEFSASAAELLAGAIQDNHRAKVLGTRSFGKGSVQSLIGIPGGAALKLTTAIYHTPSGRTLQAEGIVPDEIVTATADESRTMPILRENDISGRLDPATNSKVAAEDAEDASAPIPLTDDELRLGVARIPPFDPKASRDRALKRAHDLLIQRR